MKPKRSVLLYCANTYLRGEISDVLDLRVTRPGIQVIAAGSRAEVELSLSVSASPFAAFVIYRTFDGECSGEDASVIQALKSKLNRLVVLEADFSRLAIVEAVKEVAHTRFKRGPKSRNCMEVRLA